MLSLVISEPRPEPRSAVVSQCKRCREWGAPLHALGGVRSVRAKVGRGAVALSNVPSYERPSACFEVHTLIEPAAAQAFLNNI